MLSAVLQKLREMNMEPNWDRKRTLIDVCSSAYPDVRPWQVRQECMRQTERLSPQRRKQDDDAAELYYIYLSQLLHPTDGHDTARHDSELVKVRAERQGMLDQPVLVSGNVRKSFLVLYMTANQLCCQQEWCELSARGSHTVASESKRAEHRRNFLYVASSSRSDHIAYRRDLAMLLSLCIEVEEYDAAFELCKFAFISSSLLFCLQFISICPSLTQCNSQTLCLLVRLQPTK
jgi:hypothetical protein